MNTFNDDKELAFFEEPPRRPTRDRGRRPQPRGPRRTGPPAGPNPTLRLAGLVALGILIVFGFVFWVGSCGSQSAQGYSSYINAMRPLAQGSAKVGNEFATAIGTQGLTLQSFTSDLRNWSQQEQGYYLAAQRLQPPGPLQSAHAEALATFELRYRGLAQLGDTLTFAHSKHVNASVAAAALASDAQLLSASDTVWEQLYKLPVTQTLNDQNVTGVIVPGSRIVTSPDIVSAQSLAIVYQRVGTSTSTGGHVTGVHGSNLIGTNAVENGVTTALSTSATTTVTAGSGSNLVIDVVFENSGGYPEVGVVVTLSVNVSGKSVYTTTKTVSQIAVGGKATASFDNVPVPSSAFGNNASISVSIARVPGEARLDNNAATYPVLFQLSSG